MSDIQPHDMLWERLRSGDKAALKGIYETEKSYRYVILFEVHHHIHHPESSTSN
jgi:hypothetical protein